MRLCARHSSQHPFSLIQSAWDNRTSIYLVAAGCAEFIADLFLCPLEAVRIRSVSDKSFPQSLPGGFARILSTEGVGGFYAGLGPILFKQIPYTMAKFAVQGAAAEQIYALMGAEPKTSSKVSPVVQVVRSLLHPCISTGLANSWRIPSYCESRFHLHAAVARASTTRFRWDLVSLPELPRLSSPTQPTLCFLRSTRLEMAALARPQLAS